MELSLLGPAEASTPRAQIKEAVRERKTEGNQALCNWKKNFSEEFFDNDKTLKINLCV